MGYIGKDHAWFINKVKDYHGKTVEILSPYNGSERPIDIVYHCKEHGDTYATLNAKNICKDYFLPCKKCQSIRKSNSAKKSKKDKKYFYDRLVKYCEDRGGIVLNTEWTRAKDTYQFKCGNPDHPVFESTADAIYGGSHWCPYCSGRAGNFEDEIKAIVESKNGQLLSPYISAQEYVTVKCNEHDYVWDILPSNIRKGRWCPICSIPSSEKPVWNYLKNNGCNVLIQYKFDDLEGKNNEKLKFDFAITDEKSNFLYLIEVDDQEHRDNHDNCERRQVARLRDIQKDEYCLKNNINFYRMEVPYRNDDKWCYDDYYRYINTELKFIVNLYRKSIQEDK